MAAGADGQPTPVDASTLPRDGGDISFEVDGQADAAIGGDPDAQSTRPDAAPFVVPPDPTSLASPVDPTVAPDTFESLRFLFEGSAPIQQGVAPDAIAPNRASLVFGVVTFRDGSPVAGARATVLGEPDLGRTHTRADGRFDLVVNGGGRVVVAIELPGFLPVQRAILVPWNASRSIEDVVLTPLDTIVTDVDFLSLTEPLLARSTEIVDQSGRRSASVLFRPGTVATMRLPDGSTAPLLRLSFRATEYTVGPTGPAAMPGPLPDASGYTYAVELSADEAIASGATRVEFTTPVVLYVDNFIGFPAGETVPVGYYDHGRAAWFAAPNGRVIDVLGRAGDHALLDIDGDAAPDGEVALSELGIDDAERRAIAAGYADGASLWRVSIAHFTPWDCNWPYGPPDGAEAPEPGDIAVELRPDRDCEKSGSIIHCKSRVLGQTIPIPGTALSLNYDSKQVPGGHLSALEIPLTGATIPGPLGRVHVEVEVAGRVFRHSEAGAPGLSWKFEWVQIRPGPSSIEFPRQAASGSLGRDDAVFC